MEGMHDIYICAKPPYRTEIPIYHVGDRIGSPYLECGLDKIACIVESDIVDHVRNLNPPDENSIKIAGFLVEFWNTSKNMGACHRRCCPYSPA